MSGVSVPPLVIPVYLVASKLDFGQAAVAAAAAKLL